MKTDTVIFLGAGASASDGAPVQNNLFRSYFQQSLPEDDFNNDLRAFFSDFFGIDTRGNLETVQFPTFEEVLGILELAITRSESFKKYALTPQDPKLQTTRELIILLIAKLLKSKLEGRGTTTHDRLIERLLNEPGQLRRTTFISLNYDMLIDNALTERHEHVDLDYGVHFVNFGRPNDWHKPRINKSVSLHKLHGSLNWLYCPTCTSLLITPKIKSVSTIAEFPVNCISCDTRMIPIIIPPSYFKVMSNFFLQQVWRNAEIQLLQCERLVFCGYSFPDADVHIKYLLKRMELNRGTIPEIFICNNHADKRIEDKLIEKQRYERFFSDKNKIHYLDISFEEFASYGLDNGA